MTKKILVTGGAGFIGSHTVVALVEAGYAPVIVDSFDNADPQVLVGLERILGQAIPCYKADCKDEDALRTIIRHEEIMGVIHFAAHKAVGESVANPLKYYENNLGSLITILKCMQESTANALIFSSSATVYGPDAPMPATEKTSVSPALSPYGNTKQIGEEILRDLVQSGAPLKGISLRYFNPIGAHPSAEIGELPRGIPNNLVPFITQTAAGLRPSLTIFGTDYPTPDGTCLRDYIHVLDLAEAHVKALEKLFSTETPSFYEVFNVGTGVPSSVLEVIQTFEAVSGQKLNYVLGERRDGDVMTVYADPSTTEAALNWKAKRSMAEALKDAWRWQQRLGA